jgi:hypothetical protein
VVALESEEAPRIATGDGVGHALMRPPQFFWANVFAHNIWTRPCLEIQHFRRLLILAGA